MHFGLNILNNLIEYIFKLSFTFDLIISSFETYNESFTVVLIASELNRRVKSGKRQEGEEIKLRKSNLRERH